MGPENRPAITLRECEKNKRQRRRRNLDNRFKTKTQKRVRERDGLLKTIILKGATNCVCKKREREYSLELQRLCQIATFCIFISPNVVGRRRRFKRDFSTKIIYKFF